eukprot:TRINITY_DN10021_c0_g1_i7.p1 TRINITY_DN10021_c0_g1~~TRINITY_DN10021_c0_g1_i7.p1  ORF type:complete len:329 (+),score=66.67 TRINITY_DN10021_c0_g1_i7:208-1194(+)
MQLAEQLMVLEVGCSVEALIPEDNLFYPGRLVECTSGEDKYTVHFDDDETHTVPRNWVKMNERREVFAGQEVVVSDGHIHRTTNQAGPINARPVRLLSFKDNPLVYQSAVEMTPDKSGFYWDRLPFELNQSFLLCLPILRAIHEELDSSRAFRVAMVGGGGGVVPMALATQYGEYIEHCTVCEISQEVMSAAMELFGLVESEKLSTLVQDGIEHLERVGQGEYDCIICDASPSTTPDGTLEAPVAQFVAGGFMQECVLPALSRRGIYMANLMGEHADIFQVAEAFSGCFESTMVTPNPNPNRCFSSSLVREQRGAESQSPCNLYCCSL